VVLAAQGESSMSLRPHLFSCELNKLTAMIASHNTALVPSLIEEFDKLNEMHDPSEQARAHEIIENIIMGLASPVVEDETYQYVLITLAYHCEGMEASESLFWEPFLNIVEKRYDSFSSYEQDFLKWFFSGRPLLGKQIETSWSFYAYLSNMEAASLLCFIETHDALFTKEYGYDNAIAWLKNTVNLSKDIWFYAY
jgi:hypothetical protein